MGVRGFPLHRGGAQRSAAGCVQVIEARNRGLPVFFGDVSRPEVLRSFNVDKARAVVVTTNEMRATNKAVVTLRKLYPDMPIYARASDPAHQKRLQNTLEVTAMVPILPEDSVLLSLPFGGRVLRKMGVAAEEVDMLLEEMRKKALAENFGIEEDSEEEEILRNLRTATAGGRTAQQPVQPPPPPPPLEPQASGSTATEIGG